MRRLALILAAFLIFAVPATAATPKQTIKAQKTTIAKLKAQLAKVKRDDAEAITGLNDQVSKLTTANTALTTENATLSAQAILNSGKDASIAGLQTRNAALVTQVSAQAAGGLTATLAGSPTDLWNAIALIYPLMPSSSLCGYDKSFYSSGNYTSYSFTRYVC